MIYDMIPLEPGKAAFHKPNSYCDNFSLPHRVNYFINSALLYEKYYIYI